jgi:hypothetical protein
MFDTDGYNAIMRACPEEETLSKGARARGLIGDEV